MTCMPIKTQMDSTEVRPKVAKKSTTKKTVAKKKLPVTVVASVVKTPAKKTASRKSVVKKVSAKKSPAPSFIDESQPIMMSVPSLILEQSEIHELHRPVEIRRKMILVGVCRNCDHMPMGVNKLVAMLSLAIAVLSGMLIYSSSPMSLRLPSISMNTLTDWVTPASHVKNL